MTGILTEPIAEHWTIEAVDPAGMRSAGAADVIDQLARIDVDEIGSSLRPHLSAAAAELALVSGVSWQYCDDDPPVALLRLIANIARRHPAAGGPHTSRLFDQLA